MIAQAQAEERTLTPQEEQVKWLQDASNSVKRNAFYMKRALVRVRAANSTVSSSDVLCVLRVCFVYAHIEY